MKKPVPIYPPLLAAFPVIALYALNLAMVPPNDIVRPLLMCVGVSAALWLVCGLVLRSAMKGAALVAAATLLFFTYGPAAKHIPELVVQVAFVTLLAVIVRVLFKTGRDLSLLTKATNFGACALVVLPGIQILERRPPGRPEAYLHVSLPTLVTSATTPEKPDIFFIIVDGYGRADQIKRVMGYSNDGFVDDLTKRGFYVANQAHSTFCQTQLSLASTLNLCDIQDFPKIFPRDSDNRKPLVEGMGHSFISAYLKKLGYTYIAVTSGFNEVAFPSADVSYDRPLALTMIEDVLLQLTPINVIEERSLTRYADRRDSLRGAWENLSYLAATTGNPRFVVAHILAPHPPFVYDAQGDPVHQDIPFGFWDGSHYMSVNGTTAKYRTGYVGQLQFLNRQLLTIVDNLLSKAKTPPVIILEGDHGSKLGLAQDDVAKTDLRECFGNLMAFYVPGSVRSRLYPKITSVNTFRVLLDGLFGEKLPLLPDRSFYSPFGMPYRFTDVTTQVAD